jgi:hypothetical protein
LSILFLSFRGRIYQSTFLRDDLYQLVISEKKLLKFVLQGLTMYRNWIARIFLSFPIVALSLPAQANPIGLDASDLAFCSEVRDVRVREAAASSQRNEDLRVNTNFDFGYARLIGVHGDSQGSGRTVNSSSSSREIAMSDYQFRNCDTLLRTAGEVTVAQIDANARVAIAQMQADTARYNADIQVLLANIDLAAIQDTNATGVRTTEITTAAQVRIEELQQAGRIEEARLMAEMLQRQTEAEQSGQTERARIEAENLLRMVESTNNTAVQTATINAQTQQAISQNQLAEVRNTNGTNTTNTLITSGAALIGTILSPPHREAQIEAETERRRIEAENEQAQMRMQLEWAQLQQQRLMAVAPTDPVTNLLAQWGWTRIACNPGMPVVAISGLSNEIVCVQPTAYVSPGNYSFDSTANQLIPATSTPYSNYPQPSATDYAPQTVPAQGGYSNSYPAGGI